MFCAIDGLSGRQVMVICTKAVLNMFYKYNIYTSLLLYFHFIYNLFSVLKVLLFKHSLNI